MMKWEAEKKGYSCNDCFLSMQNCHDMSICCEDETGLCDYFEEIDGERKERVRSMDMNWLQKAIETIKNGIADKLTKDNITVYRVKNIIRIDIKE